MASLKLPHLPVLTVMLSAAAGAQAQTLYSCATVQECKMDETCQAMDMTFALELDAGGRAATLILDGASYPLQRAVFRNDATTFVGTGPEDGPVMATLLGDGKLAMTLHEIMFFGAVVPSTVTADCRKDG